jgi:NTP pyrophosphatase (non-canonical NTP hydrolase)
MNLSIEANELLELFLWKAEDEVNTDKLKDELGDVFYALLMLAHAFDIDLREAFLAKMAKKKFLSRNE